MCEILKCYCFKRFPVLVGQKVSLAEQLAAFAIIVGGAELLISPLASALIS